MYLCFIGLIPLLGETLEMKNVHPLFKRVVGECLVEMGDELTRVDAVQVCKNSCIHEYICMCDYICIYIYRFIYLNVCIYIDIYLSTHIHVHTYLYKCIYMTISGCYWREQSGWSLRTAGVYEFPRYERYESGICMYMYIHISIHTCIYVYVHSYI
jgi:hypothetical protein